MGISIDKEQFEQADHEHFAERLNQSLQVLKDLLYRPGFGEGPTTMGAELELSIIDHKGQALPINRELLAESLDDHLQLELDRFNLEYNLSPVSMTAGAFKSLEEELGKAIAGVNALAAPQGGRVVPIGILPTLTHEDLRPSAMSDLPRYRALSAGLRRERQSQFAIHIDGPNPLSMNCDDVTLEGANTSFQVHLRVSPKDFARVYNAAQLVTPIALAFAANSPIFLGHWLWDETRVALFKQSIDGRAPQDRDWRRPARVVFGHGWVRHGAYELFAEAVGLHPALLPVTGDESPLECLRQGRLPGLDELRLHQGTVWRWNRPIYDPASGGHLRIEFRALPSGPTPLDMAANAAFLVGMSLGLQEEIDEFLPFFPFEYAQHNFYRAAQYGLEAILLWPSLTSPSPQEMLVSELAVDMLPVAERGLARVGVEQGDIQRMLRVIRSRIDRRQTPAQWQRQMVDRLLPKKSPSEALVTMLEAYLQEVNRNRSVADWGFDL